MRKYLLLIIVVLCSSCAQNSKNSSITKAYNNYMEKTETLLDSCSVWDDCFMDTIGETDTYEDYCEAVHELYEQLAVPE